MTRVFSIHLQIWHGAAWLMYTPRPLDAARAPSFLFLFFWLFFFNLRRKRTAKESTDGGGWGGSLFGNSGVEFRIANPFNISRRVERNGIWRNEGRKNIFRRELKTSVMNIREEKSPMGSCSQKTTKYIPMTALQKKSIPILELLPWQFVRNFQDSKGIRFQLSCNESMISNRESTLSFRTIPSLWGIWNLNKRLEIQIEIVNRHLECCCYC
jgi:hypothetical protein